MLRRSALLVLSLFVLAPVTASAVTVSGQVTDEQGFGIFNVDLDFEDLDTGQVIFTPFDNTDAGGFYSVDVPIAEYLVTFKPPTTEHLVLEIEPVIVNGPRTLNATLFSAQEVTGSVQSEAALPLANVDLDFFDSTSNLEFEANGDNTDISGNFDVFVPSATYDIYFTPPLGQPYAGKVVAGVDVSGPTAMGTITLPDGQAVTAQVQNPSGGAVTDADTDFVDVTTLQTIYTPRDNTDLLGNLSVFVPQGTYNVIVKSNATSTLAWKTVPAVAVVGATNLGTITLPQGHAVTGTVRDPGAVPIVTADLDLIESVSRVEQHTPDDNTNGTGVFSLLSPVGTFDVLVKPPSGVPLSATVLRNVSIAGATNLGTITLTPGITVSGTVKDGGGIPVVGADIDAFELGSGLPYPTVDDDSAADGSYLVRLVGGSYTLTANPPPGSGLQPASVVIDPLNSPTVVNFVLNGGGVGVEELASASNLTLLATPNPFRGATRLSFVLPEAVSRSELAVYDAAGRRVFESGTRTREAGRHEVVWNGRDTVGRPLATGVYFVRLVADQQTLTQKVVRLR